MCPFATQWRAMAMLLFCSESRAPLSSVVISSSSNDGSHTNHAGSSATARWKSAVDSPVSVWTFKAVGRNHTVCVCVSHLSVARLPSHGGSDICPTFPSVQQSAAEPAAVFSFPSDCALVAVASRLVGSRRPSTWLCRQCRGAWALHEVITPPELQLCKCVTLGDGAVCSGEENEDHNEKGGGPTSPPSEV
jgi:hypothetical protein